MLSYCRTLASSASFCLVLCALPASAATITLVSATPTSFPTTAIGATSTAQTVQFTLTTAVTLSAIAVPPSIGTAQEFVVGALTGCKADGTTLNAAGSICSLSLTFKPAYPGPRHQPLTITDSTGQTYAFALTGTATGSQSIRYPGTGSTLGGGSTSGYSGDGGPATSANITSPYGLTTDNSGNIYFADYKTDNIRIIYQGNGTDHLACLIEVAEPALFGLATGATSCTGATSRPVAGNIYTLAGDKTVYSGTVTSHTTGATGDGGIVSNAKIAQPASIAVDATGNIFFGDYVNYTIRVIYSGGPQVACLIQIENPTSFGLTAGATSCAGATSQPGFGTIWTLIGLSGTPSVGPSGDGGLATSARTVYPYAIAVSPAGDIFFTDDSTTTTRNARIRVIYAGGANAASLITLENPTVLTPTLGFVYRLAGNTTLATDSGDGTSLASAAGILYARGIALDPNGNVFFTEYDTYATASANPAHKLRAIYLQGSAVANLLSLENNGITPQPGYIYDVAGINGTSSKGYSGDGALASTAQLNFPYGVALDPAGNLYIGDASNFRIRKVNLADGIITTAFGTGIQGVSTTQAWSPYDIAVNSDGTIAFADYNAYRIRQLSVAANTLTFASATTPQNVSTTSAAQSVIQANIGNTTLTMSGDTVPSAFLFATPSVIGVRNCNNTADSLAVGAQCAIAVTFSPTTAGTFSGNLNIVDTALNTTSTTHSVAVIGYAIGLQLTTSAAASTTLQPITLTAAISGTASAPTGSVLFTDLSTGTPLGTVQLAVSGTNPLASSASQLVSTLAIGVHQIQATYSGDTNFNPATSNTITETISLAVPSLTLTPTTTTPNLGATDTFTAAISSTLATPTGSIAFSYAGSTLASSAIASGTASYSTSALPVGQDCITATYSGDNNFASTSVQSCITVIAPSYKFSSTTTGVLVPRGGSTLVPLTIITVGGYANTITGSCSNLPVGVTCAFVPQLLVGTGTNGTLNWSVVVAASNTASLDQRPSGVVYAILFPFSILGLAAVRRRKSFSIGNSAALLLLLLTAGISLSGCTGSSGSPKETVNININTTDPSNSTTASQSIPLTITITGSASH